jgi:hypothetical protein
MKRRHRGPLTRTPGVPGLGTHYIPFTNEVGRKVYVPILNGTPLTAQAQPTASAAIAVVEQILQQQAEALYREDD